MKGIMSEKKATRVENLEQFCQMVARDLNNIVAQLNSLGNILQATVNVLGPGAVQNEMARLASPPEQQGVPPVSEEDKADIEAALAAEAAETPVPYVSPVEEPGADQAEDGPPQSP